MIFLTQHEVLHATMLCSNFNQLIVKEDKLTSRKAFDVFIVVGAELTNKAIGFGISVVGAPVDR